MNNTLETIESILGKGRIRHNESLHDHTALRVGGTAEFYVEIEKMDTLIKVIQEARKIKLPLTIFGVGSWINFPDRGVTGLVIKNNCHRFDFMSVRGKVRDKTIGVENASVYAEAGANMNQLVRFTLGEGLGGLEYQLGLPGSVGGAIYTNARYTPTNSYVADVIDEIRIVNKHGEIASVPGTYFVSQSKESEPYAGDIILSAIFRLQPQDSKILWERGMEAAKSRNEASEKILK
jgi:UDP-N-acetylmuramate dehydrogenase